MTQPPVAGSQGPFRIFLDTLDTLTTSTTTPMLLRSAKLRAAIATFLMAPSPIPPDMIKKSWGPLLHHLRVLHKTHNLPETAIFLENLPGLFLHRLDVVLPDDNTQMFVTIKDLKEFIGLLTGPEYNDVLKDTGLRVTSALGPVNIRQLTTDWLAKWEVALNTCLAVNPHVTATIGEAAFELLFVPLGHTSIPLITPHYSLIFPSPLVQECLRRLAQLSNWMTLFSIYLQQINSESLTPLTRALFTLAMVDECLTDPVRGAIIPPKLLSRFKKTVQDIDPMVMIPPLEANKTLRSRGEIRISSALNHLTPKSTTMLPGTLLSRVRTDSEVFSPQTSLLSPPSLAIFQPAILSILNRDSVLTPAAAQQLLGGLQTAWAHLQHTSSPSQALSVLVSAGFTLQNCTAYLTALEGLLVSNTIDTQTNGAGLSEIEQLIGCVSITGMHIFTMAAGYGYDVSYVRRFRQLQRQSEFVHIKLNEAVGLAKGVLSQTLAKIMGPRSQADHVKNLRRGLVEEFEALEHRFSTSQFNPVNEAMMVWLDVYGQTAWDITPIAPTTTFLSVTDRSGTDQMAYVTAATQISFPNHDGISANILADPGFAPYALALVVGDALHATHRAAYHPKHIEFVLGVLKWARDFGLGYLPTIDGHRTKIGALVTLLEPGLDPTHTPTMQTVNNIERLLNELYHISTAARGQVAAIFSTAPDPSPNINTNLLLLSLTAVAACGVFRALINQSIPVVQHLEDAVTLLRICMDTLKIFFSCNFQNEGNKISITDTITQTRLGSWRPNEMADAVTRYCEKYQTAKHSLITAMISLKSIITEATTHLEACDTAADPNTKKTEFFREVIQQTQTFVLLLTDIHTHVTKLVAGNQVPGFFYMGRFISAWRQIEKKYKDVCTHTNIENITALIDELRETWDNLQVERAVMITDPITTDSQKSAVAEILGPVGTNLDTDPEFDAPRPIITDRSNIARWEDYDTRPLKCLPTYPTSVDLTPEGLKVLLGTKWILISELLQIIDGVFRTPILTRDSPTPPQPAEVTEEGSLVRPTIADMEL
ncbi:tegument protein [Macropodid alphaherpesvirus 1]|uniref:Tegument protein n=1 Tax=Macropodid alphaherpesvirus 1 TaxID=137443 RepID=A0A0Y0A585_9ALPH|nr:tegument protein [Macropodid alphaherpesvirus 1]AMB16997.1 tegument protein [Macropodid alphaherpesvirus 1]